MIVYLVVLTLASWACLWPMLRFHDPYPVFAPAPTYPSIPDTTFDPRGFC